MKRNKQLMENVVVTHGKDRNERSFTVAGRIVGNQIRFGIAICNETDQFCRKTGRKIAATRTIGRPIEVIENQELSAMDKSNQYKFAIQKLFEVKEKVENVETFFVRNQS